MNLAVMGAGYVGLTTAICLASQNHKITIFDIDNEKIKQIQNKKLPFFENGLQEILEDVISSNNLVAVNNLNQLVEKTDGCFICVGTPTKDNSIDLTQIINATESLANSINENNKKNYQIIVRSTVIPNTTKNTILPILNEKSSEQEFGLCVVPEFLREGKALDDFMNPDKIVIGSFDKNSTLFVKEIFKNFKDKCEFVETNLESAELIKYTNNAFFSMLISFSNEIANISEKISGVDSYEILKALVLDKRITSIVNNEKIVPSLASYLIPGCGFGGSCFPKDVQAMLDYANKHEIQTPLLEAVLNINAERPNKMVLLSEYILGELKDKKISILGLTFKPETDDLRSSPALDAIQILLEKGANIFAFDPILKSKPNFIKLLQNCTVCTTIEDVLRDSDIAMIFTKWSEFKSLDSKFLKQFMKNPIIIDGRGFLDKEKFDSGTYFKIGYSE
jgi:UDPglucose 6-dehydrogenase/GDP-mannose 6-dehydrogenase